MSKIKKNSDLSMFWPDFGEERISGGSLISLWAVAGIGGSVRVPAHHLDPRTGLGGAARERPQRISPVIFQPGSHPHLF